MFIEIKQYDCNVSAVDTFQHRGKRELLSGSDIGAAFVKLLPHVQKRKETFWKDEILKERDKALSENICWTTVKDRIPRSTCFRTQQWDTPLPFWKLRGEVPVGR